MIAQGGISGLTSLFASGAFSPSEICEHYLLGIAARDEAIGAFVHVDMVGARAAAQASSLRWRANAPLSKLDGVPIGIKANIAVAGLPWHAGIAAYGHRIAEADAACVAQLRALGMVFLGLLNMDEAALGGVTDNASFGRTQNPWRHGFTAGGSSGGGAAAVAAGLCAAALGTDTLGSVRIPASYCGVYGHKPASGAVSLAGIMPLSPRYDQIGVQARSVDDCAALLAAMQGRAVAQAQPAGRIARLLVDGQVDVEPAQHTAFAAAVARAEQAGLTVEPIRLADIDYALIRKLALLVVEVEAECQHRQTLDEQPEGFSPALRSMLGWGASVPASRTAQARLTLEAAADTLRRSFAPFTAVLAPTTPQAAFAWSAAVPKNQAELTVLANITGHAAMAMPAGLAEGLPLSFQVIGAEEASVFGVATACALLKTDSPPGR
jgi:aspartyl-tRNA(Asn)/glutamyl-tRNA(Gln) amidotransferase subunit A